MKTEARPPRRIKFKWWYIILAYLLFAGLVILLETIIGSRMKI